jgi:cytochrome c biogenesis protein CcmG/thiol:disulfide interchange protein DsbE
MNKRLLPFLPLVIFGLMVMIIGTFLWRGENPSQLNSALIGKPVPRFVLPALDSRQTELSHSGAKNNVTIINFFASWCVTCAAEQKTLLHIKNDPRIQIWGIAYKDKSSSAKAWLERHGNPFARTAQDMNGKTAVDFGVYGVPETFVIDQKGIVRYRHAGPLTQEDLDNILLPLIKRLSS